MFDLLRARPARKAALSALEPFVQKTSANGAALQAGDWLQPQILGFLATLVTLIVARRCGTLQTHALASVQSSVLHTLTGIGPELIGEEICLLSSRCDPAFTAGSQGALSFLEIMEASAASAADLSRPMPGTAAPADLPGGSLAELWYEHVERQIRRDQPFA